MKKNICTDLEKSSSQWGLFTSRMMYVTLKYISFVFVPIFSIIALIQFVASPKALQKSPDFLYAAIGLLAVSVISHLNYKFNQLWVERVGIDRKTEEEWEHRHKGNGDS